MVIKITRFSVTPTEHDIEAPLLCGRCGKPSKKLLPVRTSSYGEESEFQVCPSCYARRKKEYKLVRLKGVCQVRKLRKIA